MLFGFSVPAYASAFLYKNFFAKLEARIAEAQGGTEGENADGEDDERIFHDELQIGE
jgi:hypothetical protein